MTAGVSQILAYAVAGTGLTPEERSFFAAHPPAGVTLFRRNIPEDQNQTVNLTRELQGFAGDLPMIIAIDQEGGRVARLKAPFPDHGPAMALARGRLDDEALAELARLGAEVGRGLLALCINVNFAPVVDILTEPANIAIGDRAFGTDVEPVCRRAGAWLDGLQSTGIKGCLKHFPGQGDAKVDTHLGGAVIDLPRTILDQRELVPYRALLGKVEMVMVSHCIYPQLAPEEASRSPKIIGGLLRGEMGYDGVVVSDDMNMGALPQDEGPWQEAIADAVAAGVDLVLICKDLDKCRIATEGLERAAARSRALRSRIEDATRRVRTLRGRLAPG